ncbi:MAG: hypothetical protein OFPI_03240 [Osedax symbiont Rs2]|nr:MAG: hypothetical protein OFPI_03240 [Osedax symbiont Rs2]
MLYVLPDSAGDILVLQASQILSETDYQNIFLKQIQKQLKTGHKLRVLLYFDHQLSAIEEPSSWCVQRFYKNCQVQIARVAVVSDGSWSGWSDAFASEQVRHFKVSEFLQALHWTDEADL